MLRLHLCRQHALAVPVVQSTHPHAAVHTIPVPNSGHTLSGALGRLSARTAQLVERRGSARAILRGSVRAILRGTLSAGDSERLSKFAQTDALCAQRAS